MGTRHAWSAPATAPASLVLDPTVSHTAARVYLALQVSEDVSIIGIAADLRVHRSTVRRALDELIEADYLRVETPARGYALLDGGGPVT
jgi:predicted ArsR family transcriptional regulator